MKGYSMIAMEKNGKPVNVFFKIDPLTREITDIEPKVGGWHGLPLELEPGEEEFLRERLMTEIIMTADLFGDYILSGFAPVEA